MKRYRIEPQTGVGPAINPDSLAVDDDETVLAALQKLLAKRKYDRLQVI